MKQKNQETFRLFRRDHLLRPDAAPHSESDVHLFVQVMCVGENHHQVPLNVTPYSAKASLPTPASRFGFWMTQGRPAELTYRRVTYTHGNF